MSAAGPALVVLGNLLIDDLVFADGRTRMGEAGGAVLHAALGAGLWCDRVGCVSVRGADYPPAALGALAARGVDLAGVRSLAGPGVRTWLLYEPAGRRMVTRLGGPSHEDVSPAPEDVPEPWLGARAFHLAPMPFERQRARGRGSRYTPLRGLIEGALERVLASGWSARLADSLGLPDAVRTIEHDVAAPGWPDGAPPLRVAFASDLHAGPTTHPRLLERACAALAAARPDVLLLGGDFVFLRAEHIDPLAEALGRVPAPLGRFAVLGNHDLWADDRYIVRRLEAAGVAVLVNRAAALPPPFSHVSICGLDDPWVGRPDADAAFRGAGPTRVLLMHAPAGLLLTRGHDFTLALCGHTHGGHIALPGGVPVVAPGPLSRRYPHGRHQVGPGGRATLVVSRGVGGIESALRLFADPDVLLCRLGPPGA